MLTALRRHGAGEGQELRDRCTRGHADARRALGGVTLATGILVDAFVVRMTLVPALMAPLGERAWWLPRRLVWLVPRLDLEGEQLSERLA